MATILTKRSNTASSVPVAGDLTNSTGGAELAVNTADKRLFTKDSGGTVVELGTNPSSITLASGTANAVPYLNGSKVLTSGSALTFDGSNLGLGVTPSAFTFPFTSGTLQMAGGFSMAPWSSNAQMYISTNAYYNSGWKYNASSKQAAQYFLGDGGHAWYTAPSGTAGNAISFTQAMTLDASGNLGIGTSSPSYRIDVSHSSFDVARFITSAANTDARINIQGNGTGLGALNAVNNGLVFQVAGTERARIDSSGNLLVGTTSSTAPNPGFSVYVAGAGNTQAIIGHSTASGSGQAYITFQYNGATTIGSITQNGTTGVLYNLTSDYRLKNNPVALTGSGAFIDALQPKTWDWWDGSGKGVGFIAHEFMEVAKYSGNGEKDAVDADGKPVYQSIQPSSSEVMANLVAEIQSLRKRLAAAGIA